MASEAARFQNYRNAHQKRAIQRLSARSGHIACSDSEKKKASDGCKTPFGPRHCESPRALDRFVPPREVTVSTAERYRTSKPPRALSHLERLARHGPAINYPSSPRVPRSSRARPPVESPSTHPAARRLATGPGMVLLPCNASREKGCFLTESLQLSRPSVSPFSDFIRIQVIKLAKLIHRRVATWPSALRQQMMAGAT